MIAFAPEAAARAAGLGAHREAVRQYRRALRYADRLPDLRRAELLWSLGYECYLTNLIDDALGAVETARMIWAGAGDDRPRRRLLPLSVPAELVRGPQ